jgi:ribosomal protein S18 acetylase RimI-like enzyme
VALTFRHYSAEEARGARDMVEAVYQGAYWQNIKSGDPFSQPSAFMRRYDAYAANPLFDLVVAFEDGRPVGQAWGWALSPDSRWWEGLETEPEPGFTAENGTRTFALSEIMVVRDSTGHGIARALHDELLRGRHEQRATLLVRPANTRAYGTYLRWGWRAVAKLRPHWQDAPIFDVLILALPPSPRTTDQH